jgi:beta-phosphoglucomutase family hydrolase
MVCRGAVFDLDGVITQTARVHAMAWKKTFDEFLNNLSKKTGTSYKSFTHEDDYIPYVDGKPRYQGVKSFLNSRDIEIPYGEPGDTPKMNTVCGVGNRKNEFFRTIVAEEGVDVYETTVEFIKDLLNRGIKVGVASSSMNCRFILETAGIVDLFETLVDGVMSKEIGLKGKPEPDIFLVATNNMGLHPNECFIAEDAISGVEAGKNGNFALVLGLARGNNVEALEQYGADIVVEDMGEITYADIEKWFAEGIREDSWNLTYQGFDPGSEKLRETLTAIGNGYFGTRGCFEGARADEVIHYPGTYIAGVFNKLPSSVYRRTIYNNDLVNCPNWLLIEIKIGESDFFNPLEKEILHYKHNLNMKDAVVSRSITFQDENGYVTTIESRRIASMANHHIGAIQYTVTPDNYSDKITLRSALDGTVVNYGVARYRELNSKHLLPISVIRESCGISLQVRTTTSKIDICMHAKTALYHDKKLIDAEKYVYKDFGYVSESHTFDAQQGSPYVFEKLVTIYTSNDTDVKDDPETECRSAISGIDSFKDIFKKHRDAWHRIWETAEYRVEGDRFSQKVIHLHTYHLLGTASEHNTQIDAGMPARGLHGEAYRGHIFWDELFILPFYILHFPEIAKALLMYRYRRLDAAREYAAENKHKGAMYPWQSADDGKEETQTVHFNPVSGKWGPDLSRRQRHVSLAVAYNIWEYYYCTGDIDFLKNYGAEMILEIARFWASIAKYEKRDGKYHIAGVMGPDEFHEKYHSVKKGGIRDNAYTNIMVCWLMHKTIETVEHLPGEVLERLSEKIGFRIAEIEAWKHIVNRMKVPITEDSIISQFDGYMDLLELDWDHYRERYGDIHRLDRILKSEGDSPDRYKVTKQADVLMTFYLLSPGQVKNILEVMGYDICDEFELIKRNYEYYNERTSHGSTLSYVVHCAVLKYLDEHRREMWERFVQVLKSDLYDIQGGTTAEATHCGVMGGTLDILFKSFAGVNIYKDSLHLKPALPKHWKRLSFKIILRNNLIGIDITRDSVTLRHIRGLAEQIKIEVYDHSYKLPNNERLTVDYTKKTQKVKNKM